MGTVIVLMTEKIQQKKKRSSCFYYRHWATWSKAIHVYISNLQLAHVTPFEDKRHGKIQGRSIQWRCVPSFIRESYRALERQQKVYFWKLTRVIKPLLQKTEDFFFNPKILCMSKICVSCLCIKTPTDIYCMSTCILYIHCILYAIMCILRYTYRCQLNVCCGVMISIKST